MSVAIAVVLAALTAVQSLHGAEAISSTRQTFLEAVFSENAEKSLYKPSPNRQFPPVSCYNDKCRALEPNTTVVPVSPTQLNAKCLELEPKGVWPEVTVSISCRHHMADNVYIIPVYKPDQYRMAEYWQHQIPVVHVSYECNPFYIGFLFSYCGMVHTYKQSRPSSTPPPICGFYRTTKLHYSAIDYLDTMHKEITAEESYIKEINIPGSVDSFTFKNTVVENVVRLVRNGNENLNDAFRNCTLKNVHLFAMRNSHSPVVFSNTTIEMVNTLGMHFTAGARFDNVKFGTVKRHGLIFDSSNFIVYTTNVVFDTVEKYGIIIDEGVIVAKNVLYHKIKILNCEKPCVVGKKGHIFSVDFEIEGKSDERALSPYILQYSETFPFSLERTVLSAKHPACSTNETPQGRGFNCDLKQHSGLFELLPFDDDGFDWVQISNSKSLDIIYNCGGNYTLSNITGLIGPTHPNSDTGCRKQLYLTINNSNFSQIVINSPTKMEGKGNFIGSALPGKSFDWTAFKNNTIENLIDALIVKSRSVVWDDLIILNFDAMRIDGNLTVNSPIPIQEFKDVKVTGSLILQNTSINHVEGLDILDSGTLSLINSKIDSMHEYGMYLSDNATFMCKNGSQLPNRTQFTKFGIRAKSYDQLQGDCAWFRLSLYWLPGIVETRAVIPIESSSTQKIVTQFDVGFCYSDSKRPIRMTCDFESIMDAEIGFDIEPAQDYDLDLSKWKEERILLKNAKFMTARVIQAPKMEFENIKKLVLSKSFGSAEYVTLRNTHLEAYLANMGQFFANDSTVDYMNILRAEKVNVFNTSIHQLKLKVQEGSFEYCSLGSIEMLEIVKRQFREDNLVSITNCVIDKINSRAILVDGKLKLENVTIGSIGEEGISIGSGKIEMKNVTIREASNYSIIFGGSYHESQFTNLVIEQADLFPFYSVHNHKFSFNSIKINNKPANVNQLIENNFIESASSSVAADKHETRSPPAIAVPEPKTRASSSTASPKLVPELNSDSKNSTSPASPLTEPKTAPRVSEDPEQPNSFRKSLLVALLSIFMIVMVVIVFVLAMRYYWGFQIFPLMQAHENLETLTENPTSQEIQQIIYAANTDLSVPIDSLHGASGSLPTGSGVVEIPILPSNGSQFDHLSTSQITSNGTPKYQKF